MSLTFNQDSRQEKQIKGGTRWGVVFRHHLRHLIESQDSFHRKGGRRRRKEREERGERREERREERGERREERGERREEREEMRGDERRAY
jgi:hypothetical protein